MILFPSDTKEAADVVRSSMISGAEAYVNLDDMSDETLAGYLRAAEVDAERQLRVFFSPTKVIPDDAPQEEIDALETNGTRYVQVGAIDYDPEFFRADRWGYIIAPYRPIISVESLRFAYPTPGQQVWEVPSSWIRTDKKYGHIRLVPATQAFSAPLNAFIMQALGGGRTIPFMIQLRYTTGLTNAAEDYPDLLDVIRKMAVLRILQGAFLPQSGSISADGLSQSKSVDLQKWHDGIEDKLEVLREAIHGVRMTVLGVA